jgi:hypothetical protein
VVPESSCRWGGARVLYSPAAGRCQCLIEGRRPPGWVVPVSYLMPPHSGCRGCRGARVLRWVGPAGWGGASPSGRCQCLIGCRAEVVSGPPGPLGWCQSLIGCAPARAGRCQCLIGCRWLPVVPGGVPWGGTRVFAAGWCPPRWGGARVLYSPAAGRCQCLIEGRCPPGWVVPVSYLMPPHSGCRGCRGARVLRWVGPAGWGGASRCEYPEYRAGVVPEFSGAAGRPARRPSPVARRGWCAMGGASVLLDAQPGTDGRAFRDLTGCAPRGGDHTVRPT